jgi:hypothetical protein
MQSVTENLVQDSASQPHEPVEAEALQSRDSERLVCDRVNLLAKEYASGREILVGDRTLIQTWDMCLRRLLGDHWDRTAPENIRHFTINKVLGLVLSHTAAETEQDPSIKISPTSLGEEPRCIYFKPKGGRKLMRLALRGLIAQQGYSTAQIQGLEPIEIGAYEELTQPDPATGAKPPMTMDDFWVVDAKLLSKMAQDLFDHYWQKAAGYVSFIECEYLSNTFGHQPWLLEIQPEPWRLVISCPHIMNVLIDPTCTTIENADSVVFDSVISVDRAKALNPQMTELFDAAARQGVNTASGTGFQLGAIYDSIDWQRNMVVIRTLWERHYRFPLTVEQALASGKVVTQPMDAQHAETEGIVKPFAKPEEPPAETPAESEDTDDATEPVEEPVEPADETAPGIPDPEEQPGDGLDGIPAPEEPAFTHTLDDGTPVHAGSELWPQAFYLAESGERVDPDMPDWPFRIGVRELQILRDHDRVIFDGEVELSDIPMAWNRNIIIPHSPYGLGEPANVEPLQQFVNRLATNIFNIVRFYAYPAQVMPQSVKDSLERAGQALFSAPNTCMGIDDELYERFAQTMKGNGFTVPTPEMPESVIRLLNLMLEVFDRLGGNVDVMQGTPPSSSMSGAALAQLTANAKGPLGLKSKFSEHALTRMATLVIDALMRLMPEEEWAKHQREYPPHVFQAIREAMVETDWTVEVQLVSGRGANRAVNRANALEEWQAKLIDQRTALEKMEEDADVVMRRIEEDAERAAMEQSRLAQPAMPGPGQPGTGQPQAQPQAAVMPQAGA